MHNRNEKGGYISVTAFDLRGTGSGYRLLGVTLINISINFFHIKKLPPKLPPFLFGGQRAGVSCSGQERKARGVLLAQVVALSLLPGKG